ncbi:MAG: N-acetylgalactosamine-6-sulfatase, partial [Phycisphaeraceae bacterium]
WSPWKMLMTTDGERVELYHMWNDPQEQNNLAEEQLEVAKRLQSELQAWLAELPEKPDANNFSKLRKQ